MDNGRYEQPMKGKGYAFKEQRSYADCLRRYPMGSKPNHLTNSPRKRYGGSNQGGGSIGGSSMGGAAGGA